LVENEIKKQNGWILSAIIIINKHMRLFGLGSTPGVYQYEKTTIKKGLIVREFIWKDTNGNELEKVSDRPAKFIVKKSQNKIESQLQNYLAQQGFEIQFRKPDSFNNGTDDLFMDEILILFSLFLLFLSAFYLGFYVATLRKPHKTTEQEIQNVLQLEPYQILL